MKKEFVQGILWTFGEKIGSILISFVTLSILSRLLNAEIFGAVSIILILIGLSKYLSDMGFGSALVQKDGVTKEDYRSIFSFSIIITSIFSLFVFVFSFHIANYFKQPDLVGGIQFSSILFFLEMFYSIQMTYATKNLKFKNIAYFNFFAELIGLSLIPIFLAFLGFGLWSLLWGFFAKSILLILFFNIKFGFIMPSFSLRPAYKYLYFGSYFTLARIVNYFASQGDYLVIGRILGASSLGYYSRSYQIMASPVNLLGGALQKVFN